MRIDSIFGTNSEYSSINTGNKREQEEQQSGFPLNWQPDNVNISEEARSAYAALLSSRQAAAGEEEAADRAFSEYVKAARGEAPSADEDKDELEELYEQLGKLQTQLFQIMSEQEPDELKQPRIAAINAQINGIQAQIDSQEKA